MGTDRKPLIVSVFVIAMGTGWLLTVLDVVPGVDWAWVLGLGTAGTTLLLTVGFNKLTVVVGPFLIASTFFSLARQTGRLSLNIEVPMLVILIGVLMMVSYFLPVPAVKLPQVEGDGRAAVH